MSERIRVLVVDDHPVFRRGLLAALADADDIDVVDAVGTGTEAKSAAALLAPDVVLLDLNLSDSNGIDVTTAIIEAGFTGRVLILTMYSEDAALVSAMNAGARGYLLKGASQDEIISAIRAVTSGALVFGGQVSAQVAARVGAAERGHLPALTQREEEVLGLMADGRTNTEIARILVLGDKTVRNHITNIFSKLQVTHRAEAVSLAHGAGLGTRGGYLPWH